MDCLNVYPLPKTTKPLVVNTSGFPKGEGTLKCMIDTYLTIFYKIGQEQ